MGDKKISISKSRLIEEKELFLTPFQVDVQKILHSKAYARYADKTQVVYLFPHDHIASRGLHVQLVSFFARSIGAALGFDVDLIEAISLGHDMGHAPFGHEGEVYLNQISLQNGCGSFSHSRQSCKVVEEIEPLNLTFGVLDGFLTHDGGDSPTYAIDSTKNWMDHEKEMSQRLFYPESDIRPATVEAALVKVCDTSSYIQRDVCDAMTLGIVCKEDFPKTIFGNDVSSILSYVRKDLVDSFRQKGVIALSEDVYVGLKAFRQFNFEHIYRHKQLKTESKKIQRVYQLLFEVLLQQWNSFKESSTVWKFFLQNKSVEYIENTKIEQVIIDYIAGMTDGYFLRLFESIYVPKTICVPDVLPFS